MIDETITRIEERLRAADLTAAQRAELEQLLGQLRDEAKSLPADALRAKGSAEEDVRGAIRRLETSLTSFEASHPKLIALVNRISNILANMGI